MAFVITDSYNTIVKKINQEMIKIVSKQFYKPIHTKIIEDTVRDAVLEAIRATAVWKSLTSGGREGLDAHFGIPKGDLHSNLEELLSIWSQEIHVRPRAVKYSRDTFIMSYEFEAIRADWVDVLHSDAGVTYNDSKAALAGKTAPIIPWLTWLLLAGDQLKISGYEIDFKSSKDSRSGKALMIKKPAMEWAVPTEFGPFNTDNNFITRALALLAVNKRFHTRMENLFKDVVRGINIPTDNNPLGLEE